MEFVAGVAQRLRPISVALIPLPIFVVLVTVYTALILWLFWLVMAACYHRIMNAL